MNGKLMPNELLAELQRIIEQCDSTMILSVQQIKTIHDNDRCITIRIIAENGDSPGVSVSQYDVRLLVERR